VFNIDIYISGLFLEDQKKRISPYVTKKSNGDFDISGTIHKTLGIHFDKHDMYVNVSWACAKCAETITLVVKRFF
jgi:hypothetical protein